MASMYDDDGDLAHYFRFQQLKHDRAYRRRRPGHADRRPMGVDFDAVYPMIANPTHRDYADPELRAASDAANRTWSVLLLQIDEAFNGDPAALVPAVHTMFKLRDQMLVLLANPLPDHPGRTRRPDVRVESHHDLPPRGRRDLRTAPRGTSADDVDLRRGRRRRRHQRRDHRQRAEPRRQARPRPRGRPRRRHHPRRLRGIPGALLRARPRRTTSRRIRDNPNAPMPRSTDARRIGQGETDASGYLVQNGPVRHRHHLHPGVRRHDDALGRQDAAHAARGLRERTRFGQGRDWPLGYDELAPYYEQAERELGVSADVEDQAYLGIDFEPDYVFPMKGLPLSYLDKMVAKGVDGIDVELGGEDVRAEGPALPAGAATASPTPRTTAARATSPVGRGEHAPGRRGRPLPGQHQLRSDLPGPGQVQRRQDAGQGVPDGPRRPPGPDRRLQGRSSIPTPAG